MTLEDFKKQAVIDIEKFVNEWEKGKIEHPDHYPDEMEEGDWFDQFLIFISTQ